MKALLLSVALIVGSFPAFADTYTGVVSDVKHFHNGGVAVDLDGHYPDQRMTFYVPPADAPTVGAIPTEGAKVTATGKLFRTAANPKSRFTKPISGNGETLDGDR